MQYPGKLVPEQAEVCMHVPLPEGVEHLLLVQHLISLEPGHKPDVTVPLQHPADVDTHTLHTLIINDEIIIIYPSIPLTEQVAS